MDINEFINEALEQLSDLPNQCRHKKNYLIVDLEFEIYVMKTETQSTNTGVDKILVVTNQNTKAGQFYHKVKIKLKPKDK